MITIQGDETCPSKKGFSMGTFMTAYLAVWLAVVLYVARMGVRQYQLQRTLDELHERIRNQENSQEPPAKAA